MGSIDEKLKRMPYTVRVGNIPGGLSEFIAIQDAINYCDNETGDWVIEIYPGTYDEGDITPNGGANITLRGIGAERAIIAPVAVPAAAVIVSGFDLTLDNLIVTPPTIARPALRVTGGTCHATSCSLNGVGAGNSIEQIAGDLVLDACRVPADIDLSTANCDLHINYSLIEGGIDTAAGVLAHRMWIKETNFNNSNLNSAATGNTLLFMEGCSYVGIVTNAGTGIFEIRNSDISQIDQTNAAGFTYIYGGYVGLCGASTGSVLWYLPETREWRCIAGMNPVNFLAAIASGDTIRFGAGVFALAAQLARAIDDVKIVGSGLGTRFTLNGVIPVISAGVQDGWILKDFDVDAGLVEIQFATNSTLHNITVNGLHGTIINPDLGHTNFPGQPIIRVEEIRPLDPATTEIIKDYSKKEYQLYDPVFANPYAIMRYLERQARTLELPLNGGWTDGSTGGTATVEPLRMLLNTTAVAARDGLAYCVAAFLNSYFGAGSYDRVDWNNKIIIAFDVARTLGTHADLRGRVQLKQVNTEGVLAALGIGLEIQNYALFGETFGVGRSTVNLSLTMTINYSYRVRIELFPGERCNFYVNDILRGSITTVANLPSGLAGATSYFVASMDNAAQAVDSTLVVSPIIIWNHL